MGDRARPPTSARFDPQREAREFAGLVHRWIARADLVALVWRAAADDRSRRDRSKGSFVEGYEAGARRRRRGARQLFDAGAGARSDRGVRPVPEARRASATSFRGRRPGSACKRLNLFLRWMVRRDALDLGVWTRVPPAALVVPLDTHVIRVGRCLGLTRYTSPGWRDGARTSRRRCGRSIRHDPVKYDFSLCHLGMMNACGFNRAQGDSQCPLRGVCRPRVRTPARSRRPSARR